MAHVNVQDFFIELAQAKQTPDSIAVAAGAA